MLVGVAIHYSIGVVCPSLDLEDLGQPLAFGVSMVPEVQEEEEEDQAVAADDVDEDGELVGAVLDEEVLPDMGGHHCKLDLHEEEQKIDMKLDYSAMVGRGQ